MLVDSSPSLTEEPLREQALGLTSELREALERLHARPDDPLAFKSVQGAGCSLTALTSRLGFAHLHACSCKLEESARHANAHGENAPEAFIRMQDALGVVEQLLEWSLDGSQQGREEKLRHEVEQLLPPPPSERSLPATAPAQPANDSELDRQLLTVFADEASEGLDRCEALLLRLEPSPKDTEILRALYRQFHTLKGAAAAVGMETATSQLHAAESLLDNVATGKAIIDGSRLVDFLFRLIDSIKGLVDTATGIESPESSPHRVMADVAGEIARLRAAEVPDVPPRPAAARSTDPTLPRSNQSSLAGDESDPGVVRVESARLKALMDEVGELTSSGTDLDEQIRALTRLMESVGPGEVADQLGSFITSLQKQAHHLSKIASGLHEQVTGLQLIPVEGLFQRLLRPIRDAARQEGKLVDTQLEGGDLQLDRGVVEALHGPLLHLVRNAVSHGVEKPEVRQANGKRPEATLRLAATARDGDVVVIVEDDGAGLSWERILAKARQRGLIDGLDAPPRDELVKLIFRPGFSTCDEVTDLAGRGVGMDVVATQMETLNGRVEVDSTPGAGTTFRLSVPVTTVIREVLLVEVGSRVFAAPAEAVAHCLPTRLKTLPRRDGQRLLSVGNEQLPAYALGPFVDEPEPAKSAVAIVLQDASRAVALLVDGIRAQQDLLIRPLDPQAAAGHLFSARAGDAEREFLVLDVNAVLSLATAENNGVDPSAAHSAEKTRGG